TGGIGPTEDDLTRQALAAVMNAPLELNDNWVKKIRRFFEERGRVMPETNAIQAMIPRGATMIDNPNGTAAGILTDLGRGTTVFVMPGVPKEMKAMFTRDVLPVVRERSSGAVILS